MPADVTSRPLPADVRIFLLVVAGIVMSGGSLLFFAPEFILPRWPWKLAPFNARFLGAVYLTELTVVIWALWCNRWSPARVVLALAFTFTAIISAVTVLHAGEFSYTRRAVQLWHIVYFAPVPLAGWWLWRYRRESRPGLQDTPHGLSSMLKAEATLLIGYAVLLLAAPRFATGFWPWPVDELHGRMYASVFAVLGQGAYLLCRRAAPAELVGQGLGQIMFGLLSVSGLLIVDGHFHWIDWSLPLNWLWPLAAAAIGMAGAVILAVGSRSARWNRKR